MSSTRMSTRGLSGCRFAPLLLCGLLAILLGAVATSAETLGVEGRVVDAEGQALAQARVVLLPLDATEETRTAFEGVPIPTLVETTSDGAGRFAFEAPGVGFYRVRIEHSGYAPRFLDLTPLLDHRSLPTARLRPAQELEVEVRDSAGAPARARLALRQVQEETRFQRFMRGLTWNPAAQRVTTSDDGLGTLWLETSSLQWRLEAVADGYRAEERNLRAGAARQRIALSAGTTVPLLVVDPAGNPVAGAWVGGADQDLPWTRTDERGLAQVRVEKSGGVELWAVAADGPRGRGTVPADRQPEDTLEITLEPLYQITGQVREAETRRPIPGALVWVGSDTWEGFTRSDGSGYYAIGSRSKEGSLQAAAVGYTEEDGSFANHRVEPGGRLDGPTLDLAPSCWVSGRVVDEESRGIADVEIHLELSWQGRKFADLLAFRTDAEGGFRSARLPGKVGNLLRAEAEGFATAELDLGTLEPGERREGLEIVLRPGIRGVGWVVDDRDQPVVGAQVQLTEESSGDRRFFRADPDSIPTYASDAEGRFVIADLVAGRYDLEAKAGGRAPMTVRGIEVPEGVAEVDLGTLVLAPGVDLEGLVVDVSGQPVADARVITSAVGQMQRQRMMRMLGRAEVEALSGRDGRFVVEDKAAGQTLEVLVEKEGFVPVATGSVELPTDEPLRVVLRPASRVLGRVLDGDRRPVAEASVSAVPDGMRGRRLAPSATTGEDGTFEILDVEPGIVSVVAEAPGFQALRLAGLEVPADAPLEDLELVLKTGAVLIGTVLDAQGEPASGAMIFLMNSTGGGGRNFTQTDGDGQFRLDGLELGSAMVRAMLSSGPSINKSVTIEPGENTVEIEVVDGVEVRGRVVAASGEPVEGAFIEVRSQAGRSFFQRDAIVSKAGGTFTIERVPAGRYVFRAQRDGLAPGESEVVEVGEAPLDGVEIVLSAGQAIVGRVLGLDPELLPGVSIHLGRRWQRSIHPDFEGRYRIDELAPGDYTVVAEVADNSRRLERRVAVDEGVAEVELDLEFGEGFLVTGTLFHGDGPLANAEVQLDGRDVDFNSAEVVSSHDGRFRFADVPAGLHRLTVTGRDTAVRHVEEVEIRSDEDLRIDIVAGLVAGRVVDDSGTPIESARLRLDPSDQSGASQWSQSDSRGLFRFASVGEGTWRLEASRAGYRTVVEDLELSAGESREGLELRLESAAGLVLDLRAPGGISPSFVYANFVDLTGRSVARNSFAADSEGRVLIDVVPEGSWRMVLMVSGYALVDTQVTVPSDPREIALELEARLKISVPDLEENPSLARLRLVGPSGVRPWIGRETALEEEQELNRSVLEVDGLAPGLWTATVTTEDGRTYSGQVQAVVGATTPLELR